jgi:uncharacterized RDD family membrane protein YckC
MNGWGYLLRYDGKEIPLSEGDLVLGRSRSCAVRIDEETVSRSHALLSLRNGQATVRDLGSSNGLFVNGRRMTRESELKSGDVIGLGSATMSVMIVSPPEAPGNVAPEGPPSETLTRRLEAAEELKKVPAQAAPKPPRTPETAIWMPPEPSGPGEVVVRESSPGVPLAASAASAASAVRAPGVPARSASIGKRMLAGAIDLLLSALIAGVCFLPTAVVVFTRASLREPAGVDPVYWVLVVFCAGLAISGVAVYYLSGWAGRGATVGQRMMGLRLESVAGGFVSSGDVLLRLAGWLACLLTAGLLFLTVFFDREGRGFADKISNSRVLEAG